MLFTVSMSCAEGSPKRVVIRVINREIIRDCEKTKKKKKKKNSRIKFVNQISRLQYTRRGVITND
jgi:cob(I)alamin adenosyltransferase